MIVQALYLLHMVSIGNKLERYVLLNPKTVQTFQPIREQELLNLVQELAAVARSDSMAINFTEKVIASTYNIISRAAFGKKSSDHEEFILIVKDVINYCEDFEIGELFPFLSFVDKWDLGFNVTKENIKAVILCRGILIGKGETDLWTKRGCWGLAQRRSCFSHEVADAIIHIQPLEDDDDRGDVWLSKLSSPSLITMTDCAACVTMSWKQGFGSVGMSSSFKTSLQTLLRFLEACFMVDASVVDRSAGLAELATIHLALVVALEEQYSLVVIVSDSATDVEALNIKEMPLAWGFYPIFCKWLAYLARVNNVCEKSVGREAVPL
ncbi:hypothetical protein G4B88_030936 [Cannabis sativa]|uniref:RNase H type-1 domain-containing protein n=1 Tax=Cannabis sativa TaxID=3483 RepID=A0A7J6EAN4_CANSA|nr:hypothetical protein G4B88_030936 [Cannabis sativa]